ncbi:MAG TPA: cobalamin-dependent protein [Smithella sp.]|nr:cobalamin-dependent protein [Smithella sp.]
MPPRVLLTSVFKPFAVDDLYSRRTSIVELFHNQLTQYQGVFSLRTSDDSYGIHAIGRNLGIPCTVLDFPTRQRFIREIEKGYDYVGISSIVQNFQKVKWMVEQIRKISPKSKIIVGGFCAAVPDLQKILDVDYVCVGEGISFMRGLLGLPQEFEFKNPDVRTDFRELMGVPLFGIPKAPQIIVGVGCSYGCDFCCPSHFFGRRHIRFFTSGKALFQEIERVSKKFGLNQISLIGDDNFLLDLDRAEELRRCVVKSGRIFNLLLFGSADKVVEFGVERLAEMGASVLWLGRESRFSSYPKNRGIDMKALVEELRRYGIKTILSSILLLDGHTKENIRQDIDEHLACRPVFSQFAHYAPLPRTPLWERMRTEGRLLDGIPWEDMHAFDEPWFYHPHFTAREARAVQEEAYRQDFQELGPCWARVIDVEYESWNCLKDSGKAHLRARADFFARQMWKHKILLAAMDYLAPTERMRDIIGSVRHRVEKSFGRIYPLQKAAARGLFVTGRLRQWRNRLWGDVRQPPTRMTHYRGD